MADGPNEAAWWIAGVAGAGVFVWKAFFYARRDQRDDKEGGRRADLIEQMREEIRRQSAFIITLDEANSKLENELDAEKGRRRAAEEDVFKCAQRESILRRRIEELTGKPPALPP
jgi:septal ring factor EnvC (AmiA/AmiB activator)